MANAPAGPVATLPERHAVWQHVLHGFCGAILPDLSLRGGRRPTWQSREGSYVFAGSTQLSGQVLRDSHVASLLGMTHQVGAAVHQCPYAVEYSCTGRTRKGHAATDAIGCYRFNGGRYESAARRRAGLSPPLQSVAGSLAQLSTIHFPLAFSFFSCSRRAGPSARAP